MTDVPVADPPFDGDPATVTVSGVLLAAGTSARFGDGNKLLATVDDDPLVRRAAAPLVASALDEVVVVVGYEADAVRAAVGDLSVRVVENPDYESGQATSVRRGTEAVTSGERGEPAGPDAVLFALGDMPDVSPDTVETLLAAFAAGVGDPVVAAHEGNRGNPVLFGREFFGRLAELSGDTGGRVILQNAPDTTLVETGDPGVRRDVDRPDDL